ncbi:MAG: hypothetical protein ACK5EA_17075, partial [Planctomycetaceae bacterium]
SRENHQIKLAGATVGTTWSNAGGRFTGTYSLTSADTQSIGADTSAPPPNSEASSALGLPRFTSHIHNTESRTENRHQSGSETIRSIVTKSASNGGDSFLSFSSTLTADQTQDGGDLVQTVVGESHSNSWSQVTARQKNATGSEFETSQSDDLVSAGTWNRTSSVEVGEFGQFIGVSGDEIYSSESTANFSSSSKALLDQSVAMIGSTRVYKLRQFEAAAGMIRSVDSGTLHTLQQESPSAPTVTTGTETSFQEIQATSSRSKLHSRGHREDLPGGGTFEQDYGSGDAEFNTLTVSGTLTTTHLADEPRKTEGTVHVDSTTLPMTVTLFAASRKTPIAPAPTNSVNSTTGVTTTQTITGERTEGLAMSQMTGIEIRTAGQISVDTPQIVPDLTTTKRNVKSYTTASEDSEKRNIITTSTDGLTSTRDKVKTQTEWSTTTLFGITRTVVAGDDPSDISMLIDIPTQLVHTRNTHVYDHDQLRESQTGAGAYQRNSETTSHDNKLAAVVIRSSSDPTLREVHVDSAFSSTQRKSDWNGPDSVGTTNATSTSYWNVVSTPSGDQTLTSWHRSRQVDTSKSAVESVTVINRGESVESARRTVGATAPVLTHLASRNESHHQVHTLALPASLTNWHSTLKGLYVLTKRHLDGDEIVTATTKFDSIDENLRVGISGAGGYSSAMSQNRHERQGGTQITRQDVSGNSWSITAFEPKTLGLSDALSNIISTTTGLGLGLANDIVDDIEFFGQSLALGIANLADWLYALEDRFVAELSFVYDVGATQGFNDMLETAFDRWLVQPVITPVGNYAQNLFEAAARGDLTEVMQQITNVTQWFDPTPISDLVNAAADFRKGNYGAGLFSVAMAFVPFVG